MFKRYSMEDKWKRNTQHNEDKRNSTTLLDMQEEELLQNSHATAREESHFTTARGLVKRTGGTERAKTFKVL